MSKRIAGPEIERLIQLLAKVPGLGPRSARRAALHLIKKKEQLLAPLASAMGEALEKVRICSTCGNVDTSDPCIKALIDRVAPGGVTEIIIAVNATVEGQTTAHYLTDQLSDFGVKVTRLAHGVPVGGELDYLDEGTLSAALKSRTAF